MGKLPMKSCSSARPALSGLVRLAALAVLLTAIAACDESNIKVKPLPGAFKPGIPRFAYVTNQVSNTVSMYLVDAATGQFRANGYVSVPQPVGVAVHPNGLFAYVTSVATNPGFVYEYTIGADGRLIPIAGAPSVGGGAYPSTITVHPSGKYAYVVDNTGPSTGNVSQYTILANGQLSAMSPAAVGSGNGPWFVSVDPLGRYAYVADQFDGVVYQYKIGLNGALSALIPAAVSTGSGAASGPYSVTVHPSGKYAYVANYGDGTVSQFNIGAGGVLMPMTPTATVGSGSGAASGPYTVAVEPSGRYAYVTNSGDNTVSQYTINASGALTAMVTFPAGIAPIGVTADPSGKFAYVANAVDNTVSLFAIGSGGALGPASATPVVATQGNPTYVAVSNGPAPVTITPKYAYIANPTSGDVSQYTIGMNGSLTPMIPPMMLAGMSAYGVGVDPSGRFAYVANRLGASVSQYTIGAGGVLSALTTSPVGANPTSVAVDPSDQFVYVADNSTGTPAVEQFTFALSGSLIPMAPPSIASSGNPTIIAVDPSGRYAYVAINCCGISQYAIGAGGFLAAMSPATVAVGGTSGTVSVAVDPSGRYAYAANAGTANISQLKIGPTGALSSMVPATVATGGFPYSVAVDPTGRYVYAANSTSGTVTQYAIGPTGALAPIGVPVSAGGSPVAVTVDASGKYVYVTDSSGASLVYQYAIGAGGLLNPILSPLSPVGSPGTVPTGTNPQSVTTWSKVQ
jgi:YVTN family beta-propeller protein